MKEVVYSELEILIRHDMIINGFDPDIKEEIIEYWSTRL